ncbi:MAG: hypothetical protein ACLPLP_07515 [Mycobacterium sp.]
MAELTAIFMSFSDRLGGLKNSPPANAALVAAVLVLIGLVGLYKGIHALWPVGQPQA